MANRNWMDVSIGIEAGNDTWLSSGDWLVAKIVDWAKNDAKFLSNLRNSCHNFLYAYVNSTVINGISSTDKVVSVTPAWQMSLYIVDGLFGVLAVASFVLAIISSVRKEERA